MIKKYIKKPEVVRALDVLPEQNSREKVVDWINSEKEKFNSQISASITPDGLHLINNREKTYIAPGNTVIQKENGDFYFCPTKVFENLYQESL